MAVHKNCAGLTRRDCLQWGVGALAGGSLVNLLRLKAQAATSDTRIGRPTSCILVWLDGGPSHYETFDPKPEAPAGIRGEFGTIATRTPGVHFSQHMQRLAQISDQFCIVRSICHNQGNHGAGNHYMMTGAPPSVPVSCGAFVSFHPSLGSVAAHERAAPQGLPAYFSMPERSRSAGPNFLGAKYAPFVVSDDPNTPEFRVRDVALPQGLDDRRFAGRRDLRTLVDRLPRIEDKAAGDPVPGLDTYYQQGYELVTSPEAQRAFDLNKESDRVRDSYGRTPFGQRALLARRLVEAGVPFVTLYSGGWDDHTKIFPSLTQRLPVIDQSIAALIEDLAGRGLLETTLVVMLGEFGRTPQINKLGGRDHWANAMSVLFAGCGTPGGLMLGATDRKGYAPVTRHFSPENFASTIYLKLGIDPNKICYTPQGRPVHLVSNPEPIRELMGS